MGVGLIEPFCTVIDASNTLTNVHFNIVTEAEMEKRADTADISVLFFLWLC